jgi:imidazole glycerol-phosphate synthase subunit HisF
MTKLRVVAVITIRDGGVIQSEQFQHKHVIHSNAVHAVEMFSNWDVDEMVLLNVSKTSDSREQFLTIVDIVSRKCFVPLSVGGFIDKMDYADELIMKGADRLIVNTAFYSNHEVPKSIQLKYGRQCLIASIDVNMNFSERRVFVNRGTVDTGYNLQEWIKHCVGIGAGEIFLNNIQHDGGRGGYDLDGLRIAVTTTETPIIIFGGASLDEHFCDGAEHGAAAVAAANVFHYKEMATKKVKRHLLKNGFNVREQT